MYKGRKVGGEWPYDGGKTVYLSGGLRGGVDELRASNHPCYGTFFHEESLSDWPLARRRPPGDLVWRLREDAPFHSAREEYKTAAEQLWLSYRLGRCSIYIFVQDIPNVSVPQPRLLSADRIVDMRHVLELFNHGFTIVSWEDRTANGRIQEDHWNWHNSPSQRSIFVRAVGVGGSRRAVSDWTMMEEPSQESRQPDVPSAKSALGDAAQLAVLCQRNQLTALYKAGAVLPGLYFYDQEYVVGVATVPPGTPVDVLTETYCYMLDDVPAKTGYFLSGSIVGGKKKKKQHEQGSKKKQLKGKGAYGAPAAIAGNGGYNLGKLISGGFKSLSSSLKPVAKAALHAGTNAAVDAMKSRIVGAGSYHVVDETVMNSLINNTTPTVGIYGSSNESESVTMWGVAYMGKIYNNTSASLTGYSFPVNPGMASLCPHLSQAANFNSYRWEQLVFFTQSDVCSTQGSLGLVMAYADMDPSAAPYTDEFSIENYAGGKSARVDQHLMVGVECDPSKTGAPVRKLVRHTGVASGSIINYDYAVFNIYTSNIPAAVVPNGGDVARLYMWYRVKFYEHKLVGYTGLNYRRDAFTIGTTNVGAIWSTSFAEDTYNNIGCTVKTNNILTLANNMVGTFRIRTLVNGTTFANTPSGFSATGNVQFLVLSNGLAYVSNASSVQMFTECVVRATPASTDGGNTVSLSTGTFTAATIARSSLLIEMCSPHAQGQSYIL